jgi:hypothetical protein
MDLRDAGRKNLAVGSRMINQKMESGFSNPVDSAIPLDTLRKAG